MRGPVLLPDLAGVLLCFRLFPIGIVSDIEKALMQLSLNTDDRDVTQFLWVKDINRPSRVDNLIIYRFARVPFGAISSPFLLAASIEHHLAKSHSREAEGILRKTYVDNVILGKNTVEETTQCYDEAKQMFNGASMNLREWESYSSEFVDSLPEAGQAKGTQHMCLGQNWDPAADAMMTPTDQILRTKREVLQAKSTFFDPLGFHSPTHVLANTFMQHIWRGQFAWDDPHSPELLSRWHDIATEMDKASVIKIPMFTGCKSKYELYVFCDASQIAYGTVAYLRKIDSGRASSDIIFSKTRVAPLKTVTIPRLELLATLLGARIIKFLKSQLHITLNEVCLHTDSSCVLGWLRSKNSQPDFVEQINSSGRMDGKIHRQCARSGTEATG